ncbi:MAG: hypothetical protein M5R36_07250 [Deltaproteobacteria bacterium]|nr:hypothetical protein [Deltaproteobacteria bacterium]
MRRVLTFASAIAAGLCLMAPAGVTTQSPPAFWDGGQTLGFEYRINEYTPGAQSDPAVAAEAGDVVVVWSSAGQDGDGSGVYARRYNGVDIPLGGEFLVHESADGSQTQPAVDQDADGNFVVAWKESLGGVVSIRARAFNADGTPAGASFAVAGGAGLAVDSPSVAVDADGDFVVVWTQSSGGPSGVYAQRYDAAGAPQER